MSSVNKIKVRAHSPSTGTSRSIVTNQRDSSAPARAADAGNLIVPHIWMCIVDNANSFADLEYLMYQRSCKASQLLIFILAESSHV